MILSALVFAFAAQTEVRDRISWAPSLAIAQSTSRREHRPLVVIYVTNDRGQWRLTGALSDPEVIQQSRDLICVLSRGDDIVPVMSPGADPNEISICFQTRGSESYGYASGFLWPPELKELFETAVWAANKKPGSPDEQALHDAMFGNTARAVRQIKASPQGPLVARTYLAIGDRMRSMGRYKDSIPLLISSDKAAKTTGDHYRAKLRLMSSYYRIGQFQRAYDTVLAGKELKGLSAAEARSLTTMIIRMKESLDKAKH